MFTSTGSSMRSAFRSYLKDGRTLISAMDVVKIIEPILRPQKIKNPGSVRTVILDAGHGGIDSGATGALGKEKGCRSRRGVRAKKLLQENGYQVALHASHRFLRPLEKRAQFANRHANAIFVSVHFNKSKSGRGFRVWKLTVWLPAVCPRWMRRI